MITEQDLQEAIAECIGQRKPTANTAIKLAAFYTIKRELYGEDKDAVQLPAPAPGGYSFLPAEEESLVDHPGNSEFARAIDGRPQKDIWPVMDELMETISTIHPKLYRAVLDRLR